MGQVIVSGWDSAAMLESLVPADLESLEVGAQTYTLFTDERGGVLDDLIVTRWSEQEFFLVVNAACKARDIAHLREHLGENSLTVLADQALIALQGPAAREIMKVLCPGVEQLTFMRGCHTHWEGTEVYVSCSGYTGEDGFEISIPGASALALAEKILEFPDASPIGLGARDSLRLEAGLCLYGHELTADIDPVQAGLLWSISKTRRADGSRPGGFPGASVILDHIENSTALKRVGLKVEGKRPVREGQTVLGSNGEAVGKICSAGYGASFGGPIAMAYISRDLGESGTALSVDVRGKLVPVIVTRLPFSPQNYFRG
jgi:aminomethyltransferase